MGSLELQYDSASDLDILPAGSLITVQNALSGTEVLSWELLQDESVENLRASAVSQIASKAAAPPSCVQIVDICRSALVNKRVLLLFVWVAIGTPDPESPLDCLAYDAYLFAYDVCFVCGDTCQDADATDSRHRNCVRCFPDFLCEHCHIFMPRSLFDNGGAWQLSYSRAARHDLSETSLWPVCFKCLEPSELPIVLELQIPDSTWFRMALLADFFRWTPPVDEYISWWDHFVSK